jgi:ATP-dependent RNA helicase RhlE
MQSQSFSQFGLSKTVQTAVAKEGYQVPTDIQVKAIPPMMAGRDVLATAQTGTGKTAAFMLPVIDKIHRNKTDIRTLSPTVLVLAPTRELAGQISDAATVYAGGSGVVTSAIFGGVSKSGQISALKKRPQILVATPGRLLDLVSERQIDLSSINCFILDEADRMLDMGFIPDVRRIAAMVSPHRQTALFSATMPPQIEALGRDLMKNPVRVSAAQADMPVDDIKQEVLHIAQADKTRQLSTLVRDQSMFKVIVFTRTKHKASRLAKQLVREGVSTDAIHGDKSQNARQRALRNFRDHKIQVLVATDIASRGIDVADVTHVINYEMPVEPESYVHRIGRTARAGADGVAISLCDPSELPRLRAIEKLQRQHIPVNRDHPFHVEPPKHKSTGSVSKSEKRGGSPGRKSKRGRRRAA